MKTEQEQIEEMAKIIDEMYNVYTTTADDIAEGLYNAGYRKIDDLETENKQLKTECALMDDELRVARQETIDVLSELRTYCVERENYKGIQQQQNEDLLRRNDERKFHPELTLDEIAVIKSSADKANGQSTMANKVVEKIDRMVEKVQNDEKRT